jgi:Cytochrome c
MFSKCARSWRVLLLLTPLLLAASGPTSREERGRQLFTGEQQVDARMAGHSDLLPPQAYRCVNCHSASTTRPRADQDFAPLLARPTLTQPVARRGGPASVYDIKKFCRLTRDGIDPAHVMISQAMPRYGMSDQQCEDLWAYLML